MATVLWLLLYLFVLVLLLLVKQILRPANFPPGPKWLPIIGNIPEYKKLCLKFGSQHVAVTKLAEKFKTNILGLKMGNEYVVVASSYETVRNFFTKDEFLGRPDNFFIRLRCLGTRCGITGVDGPIWVEQKGFLVQHLRKLGFGKKAMEVMINDEVKEMLKILEESDPDVNLSQLFPQAILNVLWTMTTGDRIPRDDSCLVKLLELMAVRLRAFDIIGGTINRLPWLRHIIPEQIGYNLILKVNRKLKEFFSETIDVHKKNWIPNKRDDIIYSFLTEMYKEDAVEYYNDDQLLLICLDLFFGGATTTSSTLDFIFIMLILHPEMQEKVAEALNTTFEQNEPISYSDRVKVPYVEAFIMEVERMYMIAPLAGPRRALKETVVENYTIPKESTILLNIYSVHYDEEYWGDPFVFRPERFLDDKGQFVPNDRVILFGLGKRRCIGEVLARTSIFLIMSGIIRKYKVCSTPDAEPPSPVPTPGIMISAKNYSVRLIPRKI